MFSRRNLHNFADVPQGMDKRYARVVKAARMTMLPGAEQTKYLRAMISESEKKDLIEGGFEYGFEQGVEQRTAEIAKTMLAKGYDPATIQELTGLTVEEIAALGV